MRIMLIAFLAMAAGCARKVPAPKTLPAPGVYTCTTTIGQSTGDITVWCGGKPVLYVLGEKDKK